MVMFLYAGAQRKTLAGLDSQLFLTKFPVTAMIKKVEFPNQSEIYKTVVSQF